MTPIRALLTLALFGFSIQAAGLEISRPARPWEFLDATGPKSAWLGHEDGTLEAYVWPLKIVKNLRLRFRSGERLIPGASVARRIISRPGSYTIIYSGDDFEVRETLVAPQAEPGAIIWIEARTQHPLRVDVEFTRDFQFLWPASIGTSYAEWDGESHAFRFGADGHPFAAWLGSPQADLLEREYATNYSAEIGNAFTLGTIEGHGERVIAFASSVQSRVQALASYRRLSQNPRDWMRKTEDYYEDYLRRTVQLDLPDRRLRDAYDWSRLSMAKGLVQNPQLGEGLVAGYGPSKDVYRPGFAWFFGRDTFWTTFALTSAGDFETARKGIDFISRFQREDGKIPHEIAQSAAMLRWFQDFPYGFASGDATPLFVIAVRNYVEAAGDAAFARKHWPGLNKAFAFMRANSDKYGLPKNLGVGHGWVEGGPLLPVDIEYYQAGCFVEALRSMSILARAAGEADRGTAFEREYEEKRKLAETLFWLPKANRYAFALDAKSLTPVDQPSVLATVPMWFGVPDIHNAQAMIAGLSAEDHASDWGMRIISATNKLYSPEGYHYGSVWPLFTGWAAVGEYRYHASAAAFANLRANAWLALDGAGGNTTEVLSGMTYSPLSTSSPHQIWSAAMVVSPLVRGLFGLEVDALHSRVRLAPHLPDDWEQCAIRNVPVAGGTADFSLRRDGKSFQLDVTSRASAPFDMEFAPAYSLPARVTRASFNGQAVEFAREDTGLDWHPVLKVSVKPGSNAVKLEHDGWFGYSVPFTPPRLGEPSEALKVISEHWDQDRQNLDLKVSGRAAHVYTLKLTGAALDVLKIEMPAGAADEYVRKTVRIRVKP
ncbi:MAG: hypothetical protein M3O35_13945 [Acidobacteriota bacterium]|nr:hypothetical protein [Acidobacteriota bacterium]